MRAFSPSERQKVVRPLQLLTLLTWKCASGHNGVHFLDIWPSKTGPNPSVFDTFDLEMCFVVERRALFRHLNFQKWSDVGVFCRFWLGNVLRATTRHLISKSGATSFFKIHFDLEMCFAPQQRTLFRHLSFQEWSEVGVFCTFWLGHVLRATTAYTFSTSELPKVVRRFFLKYILTWKCASCHNGVHFFDISTFKSGLSMVCFVHFDLEMCFAPQRCAVFDIWTSKSGPRLVCFVHFDLEMCFAPLIWPAGSAPAALARLLFDLPEPQIIGKTQWTVTFLPFRAPASSCFSFFLFSALLTSWLLLPDFPHLCFSISPYCRKFDS